MESGKVDASPAPAERAPSAPVTAPSPQPDPTEERPPQRGASSTMPPPSSDAHDQFAEFEDETHVSNAPAFISAPMADGAFFLCSVTEEAYQWSHAMTLPEILIADEDTGANIMDAIPTLVIKRRRADVEPTHSEEAPKKPSKQLANNTITHVLSISDATLKALAEQGESLPAVLQEDKALLEFTIATHKKHAVTTKHERRYNKLRAVVRKDLRPTTEENILLRDALGISRASSSLEVRDQLRSRNARRAASQSLPQGGDTATMLSGTQPSQAVIIEAAQTGSEMPLHSPLQWEMETEAAVNARTRYNAYTNRRATNAENARKLDGVTQQHLVMRLHDKAVDIRLKRNAENDEKELRAMGRNERRVLTPSEQSNLGKRLCSDHLVHSSEVRTKLVKEYCPNPNKTQLSPAEQKESSARLYYNSLEHTKQELSRLKGKYIDEFDVTQKAGKLDKERQQNMANRLSALPNR